MLSPAPLRTVLALFTHTAPHIVIHLESKHTDSLLYDVILFPCQTCHGLWPRGSRYYLAFNGNTCVDFHFYYSVVLPNATISWLNPFNLTAYGLSARYLTLKTLCYHRVSKDSLPGGWPTFQGGIHTRWNTRPCPAAQ